MVPFRVLSRQYLAYFPHHPSLNSRRFNLLQPLGRLEKSQLLCYQANPASFCKTPGVGVPARASPLESATSSLFFRVRLQLSVPNPHLTPPRTLCGTPICSPLVFIFLRIPFPANPLFHIHSNPPGGVPSRRSDFQTFRRSDIQT